jgi:hypothetical protein
MNGKLFRAFWRTWLTIGPVAFALPLVAQQPPLPPAAIGEIANEVLRVLIPPGQRLSRIPASERGIFFDLEQTMKAFGHTGTPPVSMADLGLPMTVRLGSERLLEDCRQMGDGRCTALGWGVYVRIQPVSVTSSKALVRAAVFWPDRRSATLEEGVPPTGPASLVGYIAEVYLIRAANGRWTFEKRGTTLVSE